VSKKTEHFSFEHNFRKYCPIFSTLTRDIDIAILYVRPSVRQSVCPTRSGILLKKWLNMLS